MSEMPQLCIDLYDAIRLAAQYVASTLLEEGGDRRLLVFFCHDSSSR